MLLSRHTRRREFIGGLASTAVAVFSPTARAQHHVLHVAVLSPAARPSTNMASYRAALRERLSSLGYVDGRDLIWDYRFAGDHVDLLPGMATQLVRERKGALAAIVAESTPAARAARDATSSIPIVAVVAVDPVEAGLAASLSRPAGNVTGVAILAEELNAKRLELFHEAFPQMRRIAVVGTGTGLGLGSERARNFEAVQAAARGRGVAVEAVRLEPIERLTEMLSPDALTPFDGVFVVPDVVLSGRTEELVRLLRASGKPAIYPSRAFADAGGLIALGPNMAEINRKLAAQLDRVFKGQSPSELPFDRVTTVEVVINLKEAAAFGMTIPPSLLARADEVIE